MKAAIYTRISLDRTGQGAGIARQEEDCRRLCEERGWTVTEVYSDNDTSAWSGADRPGYDQLIGDVADGLVDVVVAYHQDRLWRSVVEHQLFLATAAEAGLKLVATPTSTFNPADADDEFVSTVIAAVAKHESAAKSRRMTRRQLEKAQRGEHHGGRRGFGHTTNRTGLVPHEADMIRDAATRILAGVSERTIVAEWQAAGHLTSTGRPWTVSSLTYLLKQPRLAALRAHHGEIVADALWPAIIDRTTHERLAALFRTRQRTKAYRPRGTLLLTGLARCSKCGTRLWGTSWIAKPVYRCPPSTELGCSGVSVHRHLADDAITAMLFARIDQNRLAEHLATLEDTQHGVATRVAELAQRADLYRARIAELDEQWLESEIARTDHARLRREARTRLADVERDLDQLTRARPTTLKVAPRELERLWPTLTLDEQRAVLATVLDRIVVHPAKPPVNRFDPARLEPVWLF